ncbi:unnamed protein product [Blepharisma stoltei]|uniref:Uncharacterized protein n=1 Tax=Blepharisma stoltei TaxID=1481888 RepID=A0AAU9I5U5_9CILI|nr:unnamed protein product [Blepharisma stoltei]
MKISYKIDATLLFFSVKKSIDFNKNFETLKSKISFSYQFFRVLMRCILRLHAYSSPTCASKVIMNLANTHRIHTFFNQDSFSSKNYISTHLPSMLHINCTLPRTVISFFFETPFCMHKDYNFF